MPQLTLLPEGESLSVPAGHPLKTILEEHGIIIPMPCGGRGVCTGCRVLFLQGAPEPQPAETKALSEQELSKGVRLGCLCRIEKDCTVLLPQAEEASPAFTKLPEITPEDFEEPEGTGAADLGTTTVYIMWREKILSFWNPQMLYGEDVVSRLTHYLDPSKRDGLRGIIVDKLCNVASSLGISRLCVSGNPVMVGILEGRDLSGLARYPFSTGPKDFRIVQFNNLTLELLPEIGGFLGSDALSTLAAAVMKSPTLPALAMDIGTNTEMFLITEGGVYGASLPAGPAFEGYGIRHGIRATAGAIYRVNDDLSFETIENRPEVGICGSGLISAVYQLSRRGLIDCQGRLLTGERYPLGRVAIYQQDIRALQLAKAAVYAGAKALMERAGISHIKTLLLAGNFGASLEPSWLTELKFIPVEEIEHFEYLGNTSLWGARYASTSGNLRKLMNHLKDEVEVLQLAEDETFKGHFIEGTKLC